MTAVHDILHALVTILIAFGAYTVGGTLVLLLLAFAVVKAMDARDRVRARRRRQRRPGFLADVVRLDDRRRAGL